MEEGEVPIISVADRNWNDDNIAATFQLETSESEVSYDITIHHSITFYVQASYTGQTMCVRALFTAFMSDASNILAFYEGEGDQQYSLELWIFKPQKSGQQVRKKQIVFKRE